MLVGCCLFPVGCGDDEQQSKPASTSSTQVAHVDGVTFHYDPEVLTLSDVRLAVPPEGKTTSFAVKLVPISDVQSGDERTCGEADSQDHPCTLAEEPGLTLALLERPYDSYSQSWLSAQHASTVDTATIDGTQGITVDGGIENDLRVTYTLVPVDGRALLIKRQEDGESRREGAAIAQAAASIDLPEPS